MGMLTNDFAVYSGVKRGSVTMSHLLGSKRSLINKAKKAGLNINRFIRMNTENSTSMISHNTTKRLNKIAIWGASLRRAGKQKKISRNE